MKTLRPGDWLWLAAAALLIAAGVLWGPAMFKLLNRQERLQEWMGQFGPWGPAVSILLNAAQVLLAPLPGQTFAIVNGFVYGFWPAVAYTLAGMLLGSWLAMLLARRFGRPLAQRFMEPSRLDRWDGIARERGAGFFFLVFLFPFFPDDLLCFVIGLSPLPLGPMLVLCALGRLPGVMVSSWLGAHSAQLPAWAWWAAGGGLLLSLWALWRYSREINSLAQRLMSALFRERR